MKKLWLFFIINMTLFASQEYFAKVEPITTYQVKSSVSGQVTYTNSALEATELNKSELIVKIDDTVNKIDLKQSQIKLANLQKIQALEQENLERFQKVSSKSKFDKDNQRIKILNVASSINDLQTRIATLEDTIKNKNLYEANRYIYNIAVEEGDYVNPGTHLYTAMDRSKGKLIVYIPIDQADTIKQKGIYIDGEKTDLEISKLYTVADEQYISSYKCEIHLPNPTNFSSLKKIEFK